jgi:hypothetical protein
MSFCDRLFVEKNALYTLTVDCFFLPSYFEVVHWRADRAEIFGQHFTYVMA